MKESPFEEADSSSARKEAPHILRSTKIHYHAHKGPPLSPLTASIHAPPTDFLKIQSNFILPPTPRSSSWSFSYSAPYQNPVGISPLPHTCHMPRPSHIS